MSKLIQISIGDNYFCQLHSNVADDIGYQSLPEMLRKLAEIVEQTPHELKMDDVLTEKEKIAKTDKDNSEVLKRLMECQRNMKYIESFLNDN